jgi:SAM-dependent methyltransferase
MSVIANLVNRLRLIINGRMEERINLRADVYERAVDTRIEERLGRHENLIRQMSVDIVERNDIMLQLFEERLDRQRREIRAMRQMLERAKNAGPVGEPYAAGGNQDAENLVNNGVSTQQPAAHQRLADITKQVQSKSALSDDVVLYHKILEWKKVAHDGMDQFPPDEQEVVDYILSFTDDPKDIEYLKTHMRRLISTLNRIPPAQSSVDRLLELGSRSPIAPAIRKYSGYNEVFGADVWDSDEKVIRRTVEQKSGRDSYTFEVRNFNVERDPFPYPDKYFRAVLCCELIEHLRSDPMHMLWECNRVLADGGYLILTTPNITSARAIEAVLVGSVPYLYPQYNVKEAMDQHYREYAPLEIGEVLTAAGFAVEELETQDVWLRSNPAIIDLLGELLISTELRGDNIFALGRKTGAPVERYPKYLYVP